MYLDKIRLQNFRTFRDVKVDLIHPDRDFAKMDMPRPRFPNLNLLLGNNGFGKSAFLKGVALAALGPAVGDAGIFPYCLVRRERTKSPATKASSKLVRANNSGADSVISATFQPHPQDRVPTGIDRIQSEIGIQQKGDLEKLIWMHEDEKLWHPIFQSNSDAFFFVGYGSTRHVERNERVDLASRRESSFIRAQRVQSLFQESYPLIPLTAWLPRMRESNKGRYTQVEHLINRLMGQGHYHFTGEMEDREYVFDRGGLKIPFPALSDGYRAYLGWIGDLLYHVAMTCPAGQKLVDNHGIVMVDEIDLHLHPKWQLTVLPILAKELPNIQFIITSHSPLLVGSLEWMNIIVLESRGEASTVARRIPSAVHGLDADQVLLTDFFGMNSTRAPGKQRRLRELTMLARDGDLRAAETLMEELARGSEQA